MQLLTLQSATYLALMVSSVLGYTWPDPVFDAMERLYLQQSLGGFDINAAFSTAITPCKFGSSDRQTAAEWLRTAYHDMATHDVSDGSGGLDASLPFELSRPENVGAGLNDTIGFIGGFMTARTSASDLIALAAALVVRHCSSGSVNLDLRVGRVDALEAGPPGVPEPQQTLQSHISLFARQGFNVTEMIGLVACGHTIGGVHGVDFPNITAPGEVNVFLSMSNSLKAYSVTRSITQAHLITLIAPLMSLTMLCTSFHFVYHRH